MLGHKSRRVLERENAELRRVCSSLYFALRGLYDAKSPAEGWQYVLEQHKNG